MYQNANDCQILANLCVLFLYDMSSGPCKLYIDLVHGEFPGLSTEQARGQYDDKGYVQLLAEQETTAGTTASVVTSTLPWLFYETSSNGGRTAKDIIE